MTVRSSDMDVQGAGLASNQPVASTGLAGTQETAATEAKRADDSTIERKEIEPSDAGSGVGDNVDIQA